ncbi:MAG: hypothetical protein LBT00_09940 [Spirochaetaceae bacterium]|nr:hypothetical protein [Spirochaetaceae bacterium]
MESLPRLDCFAVGHATEGSTPPPRNDDTFVIASEPLSLRAERSNPVWRAFSVWIASLLCASQ